MKTILATILLVSVASAADLDMAGYSVTEVSNVALRAKYANGLWPKVSFVETNPVYNMNASIGLFTNKFGEDGFVIRIGSDTRFYVDERTVVIGDVSKGIQVDRTSNLINFLGSWNINVCTNRIINVAWPVWTNDAAPKCYVDTVNGTMVIFVSNSINSAMVLVSNAFVIRSGDTMTGFLTLSNTFPTSNNHAATKAYVDSTTNSSYLSTKIYIDAMTNSVNVQYGKGANGLTNGAAIGNASKAYDYGAAVGYLSEAYGNGVAVGANANGSVYGTAIGQASKASEGGVALGQFANGTNYGVSIGFMSFGANGCVAIGTNVINTVPNTMAIPEGTPTLPNHATTKSYVDSRTNFYGVGFRSGQYEGQIWCSAGYSRVWLFGAVTNWQE